MIFLIWGLTLVIFALIVILCAIYDSNTVEAEIEVIRPWKFKVKIIKTDKLTELAAKQKSINYYIRICLKKCQSIIEMIMKFIIKQVISNHA